SFGACDLDGNARFARHRARACHGENPAVVPILLDPDAHRVEMEVFPRRHHLDADGEAAADRRASEITWRGPFVATADRRWHVKGDAMAVLLIAAAQSLPELGHAAIDDLRPLRTLCIYRDGAQLRLPGVTVLVHGFSSSSCFPRAVRPKPEFNLPPSP